MLRPKGNLHLEQPAEINRGSHRNESNHRSRNGQNRVNRTQLGRLSRGRCAAGSRCGCRRRGCCGCRLAHRRSRSRRRTGSRRRSSSGSANGRRGGGTTGRTARRQRGKLDGWRRRGFRRKIDANRLLLGLDLAGFFLRGNCTRWNVRNVLGHKVFVVAS
jgi:hypothetical protein